MNKSEKELLILEKIHKSKDSIKQRDLAMIAGLSLGMTNAILKRLIDKGLVTIKKVNSRNISYAVSPLGIEKITQKSYGFFKRTIKNIVVYKEAINDVVIDARENGFTTICLAGRSDIDFIIEHICGKNKLLYEKVPENHSAGEGQYIIYCENIDRHSAADGISCETERNSMYLKDIIP